MPIVEGCIHINAPPESLFALSQDYALRRAWDPFVRDMRFLDQAGEAGPGVRVWVRAWNGLTMTVRFTSFRPPRSVAMAMEHGPRLFRRFAGTWLFAPHTAGGAAVTFRYFFETRWRFLRRLLDWLIAWALQRDVAARLRGLKRGAETGGLLERLGDRCP